MSNIPRFQVSSFYDITSFQFDKFSTIGEERWLSFVFSDEYRWEYDVLSYGVTEIRADIVDEYENYYHHLWTVIDNDNITSTKERELALNDENDENNENTKARKSVGYQYLSEYGGTVLNEFTYSRLIFLIEKCKQVLDMLERKNDRLEKNRVDKSKPNAPDLIKDMMNVRDEVKRDYTEQKRSMEEMIEVFSESFYRKLFNLHILNMSGYKKKYTEVVDPGSNVIPSYVSWVYDFNHYHTSVLSDRARYGSYPYVPFEMSSIYEEYQPVILGVYSMIVKTTPSQSELKQYDFGDMSYDFGGYIREPFKYEQFSKQATSWWKVFGRKNPSYLAERMMKIYESSYVKFKDRNIINQFVEDMLSTVDALQKKEGKTDTLVPAGKTLIYMRGQVVRLLSSLYNFQRGNLKRFALEGKVGEKKLGTFLSNSIPYRTMYPNIFGIDDITDEGAKFFNLIRNFFPLSQKFKDKTFGDEYFLPYSELKLKEDLVFSTREIKSKEIMELLKIGDNERIWNRMLEIDTKNRVISVEPKTKYIKSLIVRDNNDKRSWGDFFLYGVAGEMSTAGFWILLPVIIPLRLTYSVLEKTWKSGKWLINLFKSNPARISLPNHTKEIKDLASTTEAPKPNDWAPPTEETPGETTMKATTKLAKGIKSMIGGSLMSQKFKKPLFHETIGNNVIGYYHPNTKSHEIPPNMKFLENKNEIAKLIGPAMAVPITRKNNKTEYDKVISNLQSRLGGVYLPDNVTISKLKEIVTIFDKGKNVTKTYMSHIFSWDEEIHRIAIDFFPKIKWKHISFLAKSLKDENKVDRQNSAKTAMNLLYHDIRGSIKAGALSSIPVLSILYMAARVFSGNVSVETSIDLNESAYNAYIGKLEEENEMYFQEDDGESLRSLVNKLFDGGTQQVRDIDGKKVPKKILPMIEKKTGLINKNNFIQLGYIMGYLFFEERLGGRKVRNSAVSFFDSTLARLTFGHQNTAIWSRKEFEKEISRFKNEVSEPNSLNKDTTGERHMFYSSHQIIIDSKTLKVLATSKNVVIPWYNEGERRKTYINVLSTAVRLIDTLNSSFTGNIEEEHTALDFDLTQNRADKEQIDEAEKLFSKVDWKLLTNIDDLFVGLTKLIAEKKRLFSDYDFDTMKVAIKKARKITIVIKTGKTGKTETTVNQDKMRNEYNNIKISIKKKLTDRKNILEKEYQRRIPKNSIEQALEPLDFIKKQEEKYIQDVSKSKVLLLVEHKLVQNAKALKIRREEEKKKKEEEEEEGDEEE